MTSNGSSRRARPLLAMALVACAGWLVFQNAVLIAWGLLGRPTWVVGTAVTVFKAVVLTVAPLWVMGCAALLGLAFATYLAHGHHAWLGASEWERGHGRSH